MRIYRACLACLIPVALLLAASGSTAAAATAPTGAEIARVPSTRAVVPVLAEAGGASLRERVRFARVRVYAPAKNRARGDGGRWSLVGAGRTGSRGVALVRLRRRNPPRRLLIVTSGGRLLGKRFRGHMKARLAYRGHHAVFVSPASSLVVQYLGLHPRKSLAAAQRAVRRGLGVGGFFDFATDLADRHLFNGHAFVRRARSRGGFDRFVARRARHLGRSGNVASSSAAVTSGCWEEAARSSAGFAELIGFTGVPSPPALPACSGGASSSVATASGVGPLDIFSALTSVASFIYGIASGQGTAQQLAAIQQKLDTIQTEIMQIQAELGGLQAAVSEVNTNVVNGNMSALIGDATPTTTAIKTASADSTALLAAGYQVLCGSGGKCSVPAGADNFGEALDLACDEETAACESFYADLYLTSRSLAGDRPLQAVENLGQWAFGSAFTGGPANPGIVQYALQAGAGSEPFFTTASAAAARLQWAYFTLYSAWAQSTYAMVLSMGIGQPLPNSKSAHPPRLTSADVLGLVEALDAPISTAISAFPNMPDTAVIVTNLDNSNGDPPYMLPQQVGALAKVTEYEEAGEFALDEASVATGRVSSSNGHTPLTTLQTGGEPPLVITPAAADGETWQLLPTSGTKRPPAPAISSATFADWKLASATPTSSLPQWNASTEKVEVDEGGLTGVLPDLYAEADPSSSQTAGQWMTASSGIRSALLMPNASGYANYSLRTTEGHGGFIPYYAKSGTDSKDPGLGLEVCIPAEDRECLLPTWQSSAVDPYAEVTQGQSYNAGSTQLNTGLFDFNNGLVIANQQGHVADEAHGGYLELPGNPSAYLNQYPNWSHFAEVREGRFHGFLDTLNGIEDSDLVQSGFNEHGRPVLFSREQASNDCFFWTGATGGNAADGTGCLVKRDTSGEILP